jgi:hypothetical protein
MILEFAGTAVLLQNTGVVPVPIWEISEPRRVLQYEIPRLTGCREQAHGGAAPNAKCQKRGVGHSYLGLVGKPGHLRLRSRFWER